MYPGHCNASRRVASEDRTRKIRSKKIKKNTHVHLNLDAVLHARIHRREWETSRVFHALRVARLKEVANRDSAGGWARRVRISVVGEKDGAEIGRRAVIRRPDVDVLHR